MSKYDDLDAKKELEQKISDDLKSALSKRGFTIKHNGTPTTHAPANVPDIETWNEKIHINIEVTKTIKSASDREMLSISDHLKNIKKSNPKKACFALFVSPQTHYRMINALLDHNQTKSKDQIILPIRFSTFELFIKKLATTHKDLYPVSDLEKIFSRHNEFIDDDIILSIIQQELFPDDLVLKKEIEERNVLKHTKLEQELFHELKTIENRLRESGIATATYAVKNMIYLVFMKLYEEKQEKEGSKNYFTVKNFLEFQQAHKQNKKKKAIHKLFEIIRDDEEFQKSKLMTTTDYLAEKLNDDFILEYVIKPLEKYRFYAKKVDGLGAAYEVLALRSSKDVKVGQFFTPKNVVQFMVKLAELDPKDMVLDPACGTGRFLIWAMDDMLNKVSGIDTVQQGKSIRFEQLLGTDNDPNVAKLAKMNMYIHGDGKTNIWDDDGLVLHKTKNLDDKIEVILTNPPLGKMNYRKPEHPDDFFDRMQVIPREDEKSSSDDGEEDKIKGNLMKGGALFVNACLHYLKDLRDSNAPLEWRGGKLLIILDEGILNTDDYRKTREFIRNSFYIKAIISLTTDTFIPVSKTPTKTSILYLIKKDDPSAVQKEPIFYAHASKVGMDTKKRPTANHLINDKNKNILSEFFTFKTKVFSCYDGLNFDKKKFDSLKIVGGIFEN